MVGHYCCICKFYPGQQEDVTLHRIPRNENRANQWINIINGIGMKITKSAVVCSKHFERNEFQYKIVGGIIKRFLTSDAVPKTYVVAPTSPSQSSRNNDEETAEEKKDNTEDDAIQESVVHPEQVNDQSEDENSPPLKRKDDSADKTTKKRARIRTIRYIGDVYREDFVSDEAYHFVNRYMNDSRRKIKLLKQKVHRMGKKIRNMQEFTDNLRSNNLLKSKAAKSLRGRVIKGLEKRSLDEPSKLSDEAYEISESIEDNEDRIRRRSVADEEDEDEAYEISESIEDNEDRIRRRSVADEDDEDEAYEISESIEDNEDGIHRGSVADEEGEDEAYEILESIEVNEDGIRRRSVADEDDEDEAYEILESIEVNEDGIRRRSVADEDDEDEAYEILESIEVNEVNIAR